ncbi:MAG: tetratricopeptide repeat protein [Chloroflexi bacterium]|nr:tetratricopeptide repeat protein [Chloroflexota bacterium]
MTTITLKDYCEKLEDLLKNDANAETIHHCRHILQFFPKNVQVYRYLGRALLENGEYAEAAEVLRRVLGVYPDDLTAHAGLSVAYQKLNQPDDAIWHLERAFEQDPNNQALIEELRELYLRYRKVEYNKLQLTTGAVARQYARSELYGQAIDVLQQALERTPERADLRVLLAQTLWNASQRIEAAEKALDVLDTLPDCMPANRILTELWLSEGRPSDAQRYLNRLEAVEPYLALELAKGQAADSDLVLEELDYSRLAQQELAMASPDWLLDLGEAMPPTPPVKQEAAPPTEPPAPAESDDWLQTLQDTSAEQTVNLSKDELLAAKRAAAERAKAAGIEPQPDFAENLEDELPPADPDSNLEDLFSDLPANASATSGFTDFLQAIANAPIERPATPIPPTAPRVEPEDDDALNWLQDDAEAQPMASTDSADPLAWMRNAGVEIDDTQQRSTPGDLFGAEDDATPMRQQQEHPMAWLQQYDESATADMQPEAQIDEDADPLAWMRDAGMEVADKTPTSRPKTEAAAPKSAPSAQSLSDEALLDEMLHMEQLSKTSSWEMPAVPPEESAENAAQQAEGDADEMPEWLEVQAPADDEFAAPAEEAFAAPAEEEALYWLQDSEDEQAQPVLAAEDAPAEESALAEWQNPMPEEQQPDWSMHDDAQPEMSDSSGDAGYVPPPETLAEPEAREAVPLAEIDDDPDFIVSPPTPETLSEIAAQVAAAPVEPPPAEPLPFEDSTVILPDAAPAPAEELPDLMALSAAPADEFPEAEYGWTEPALDFAPGAEALPAAEAADNGSLAWMDESDVPAAAAPTEEEDPLAWMQASSVELSDEEAALAEEEEAAQEDMPDWLTGMSVEEEAEAEAEPEMSFGWMDESLAEEQPLAVEDEEEALDWMVEPTAQGDIPDWLSESTPVTSVQTPAQGDIDWMAEMEAVAPSQEDAAEPAAAAMEDEFSWMEQDAEEEAEAPLIAQGQTDWLSAVGLPKQPAAAPQEDEESDYEWMAEVAEAEVAGEERPEWFDDDEEAVQYTPRAAAPADDQQFSWMHALDAKTPAPAPAKTSGVLDQDSFGLVSEEEYGLEEEYAPAPAENAPDWLNAMVPGLDIDYTAAEEAPVEQSFVEEAPAHRQRAAQPEEAQAEFGWLSAIVEEETRAPQAPAVMPETPAAPKPRAAPRFSFSRLPSWLRRKPESPAPAAAPAVSEPEWLHDSSDTGDNRDDDVDLPDWLK